MEKIPKSEEKVVSTADLAAKLGLSRWAVSRALNGRPGISKSTAARVRAAVLEHHFEPDPLARGLRGGATGMVAISIPRQLLEPWMPGPPSLSPQSVASGLNSLCKQLESNGLFTFTITSETAVQEAESLRRVLALRVDAVVLVCPSAGVEGLIPAKTSCVALDPAHDLSYTSVKFDRLQAAKLTLSHLQQLGHKRFAMLGLTPDSTPLKAFEDACPALGLAWRNTARVLHFDDIASMPASSVAYGWALAEVVLRRKLGVTALVAADDFIAIGALARLRHEGKNVPEDFALIGHGNHPLTGYSTPPITTVDPQVNRLFEQAADTLCAQMRAFGQIETQEILINPLFLKRSSTSPARPAP